MKPQEFWRCTPLEHADMIVAYKRRRNNELIYEAWKLSYTLSPHVNEESRESISPMALFKNSPGAFVDELKLDGPPEDDETIRRRNIKRQLTPRKR